MNGSAIVIVKRSDMAHNRGELFYSVLFIDHAGSLSGLVEPMSYPWAWGFKSLKRAERVAGNLTDETSDVTCDALARRLAAEERAESEAQS